MSFGNYVFSTAVPVLREKGRVGNNYIFDGVKKVLWAEFVVAGDKLVLSQQQLMDAVSCAETNRHGVEINTGIPFVEIMDAYAQMPEFSSGTQAFKYS